MSTADERAVRVELYVALLAALSVLLWLALVAWFPAPPPAADGHDDLHGPRPAAPVVSPAPPWWPGDAAGVVGAYSAGVVGVLAGAVAAPWRARERGRKPPAA